MTTPGPESGAPDCQSDLEGSTLRVRLAGPIDQNMAPRLIPLIRSASGKFSRAVVDARDVTFFGATGLHFLAGLAADGAIVQLLGHPPERHLRRLLRSVGLHTRVDLLIVEA